jgi:hypothetical protein
MAPPHPVRARVSCALLGTPGAVAERPKLTEEREYRLSRWCGKGKWLVL